MLKEREELTALIYEKPQEDISEYTDSPDELLRLSLDQFAAAFDLFLTKKQRADEVRARYTRIERDRATMEDRMTGPGQIYPHRKGQGYHGGQNDLHQRASDESPERRKQAHKL